MARCNLLADALPPHVFAGSTRAIRTGSVDVMAANINAVTHQTLAGEYTRISRRLLIVSGFPDRTLREGPEALEKFGYKVLDTRSRATNGSASLMQRRQFLTALSAAPLPSPPPRHRSGSSIGCELHLPGRPAPDYAQGRMASIQVQANHIYDELRPQPYRDNPQAPREAGSPRSI